VCIRRGTGLIKDKAFPELDLALGQLIDRQQGELVSGDMSAIRKHRCSDHTNGIIDMIGMTDMTGMGRATCCLAEPAVASIPCLDRDGRVNGRGGRCASAATPCAETRLLYILALPRPSAFSTRSHRTALETIASLRPAWSEVQLRRHLADYLFRTSAEVYTPVASLSGGEKARLCMARIGALTPRLIVLDEPSNNLDLETRNHLVQALQAFPGAMIVISHDDAFLGEIGTTETLELMKTR
jgi:hypothetical protein